MSVFDFVAPRSSRMGKVPKARQNVGAKLPDKTLAKYKAAQFPARPYNHANYPSGVEYFSGVLHSP
jgi:hypothetical protein